MKKRAALLSMVLASSAFLVACNKDDTVEKKPEENKGETKTPATTEAPKQVINLVETAEIPALDSAKSTDTTSHVVLSNTMEGLYRMGENEELKDGVAKLSETEKSADGKFYTFHLRDDAKWSNGDPVTANDFVYAWRRALDPKTASEYAFILYDIKNAQAINEGKMPTDQLGVTAVDEKTLKVELANAVPYFDRLTTFTTYLPQNEKFVTAQGDKYSLETNNLIFNGPFVLDSWKHEEGWTYKKNPNYWDVATVKLDTINVKVVKDTSTASNLYNTGTIDRAILNSEFVDQYKGKPDFHTQLDPRVFFLRLNLKSPTQPGMANVNLRKALTTSFDKEAATSVILNDGSQPVDGLVPANFAKGPDGKDFREANGSLLPYNIAEAQKYWEQAKKELKKDKLTLEFLSSDRETDKKVSEFLKGEWEKNLPGLTVNIKQVPFKQRLELEKTFKYEFSMSGWAPDYQDPMTFVDMFETTSPFNETGWSKAEYDKLIKDAKTTLLVDQQARWDAMLKAEKILMDDPAIAPVYQRGTAYVQKENVKGILFHPVGGYYSYKWAYVE